MELKTALAILILVVSIIGLGGGFIVASIVWWEVMWPFTLIVGLFGAFWAVLWALVELEIIK